MIRKRPRHSHGAAVFKGDACRNLNPLASLSLEPGGDLVCEGDRVRAVISASQIPGPACIVDHLVPFSGDIDDPVPENLQE